MTEPVYLTFDDGPDPVHTPLVLELLDGAGMKATFFVLGELVQRHPGLVREVRDRGHELGNHSFSHPHPRFFLGDDRARREVVQGTAALAEVLGEPPRLFRAPHGTRHPAMLAEAARLGQESVPWDISAIDWGPLAWPAAITRRLRKVGPGHIVLMHDGNRGINRPDQTLKVLPAFLARLVAEGISAGLLPGLAQHTDLT